MRKTKIICTLGPSTDKEGVLESLIKGGLNVVRCNFSHGSYEEHGGRMNEVKRLREKWNRPVAILLDTKGPEIRTKEFEEGKIQLEAGQLFTLKSEEVIGNVNEVSITYKELYQDVKTGDTILFDDGLIGSTVVEVKGTDIICKIQNGGKLSNHKGINVPGIHLNMPYISKRDREDILFGISQDVDFIAASFARTREDIEEVRTLLDENGGKDIQIIAKIENVQGVENVEGILQVADGIMIARGDMGVELAMEDVPVVQKKIIKKVFQAGKLVITATQMLDSMMKNPRPTRAEITDVANAVYDGTSAIMLSGETAAGDYPVEALETMIKIAERTEQDIDYKKRFLAIGQKKDHDVTSAICHATCSTALDLDAKAILAVTKSGYSARMVSRYHPENVIIGCALTEKVCRQLNLSWGVTPLLLSEEKDTFDLFRHAVRVAKEKGLLESGDYAVITSGIPLGISGTTNMIKVQQVD